MNLTFENAYLEYIEYAKLKLKPQSILKIKSRFNTHILPYFCDKKIKDISALDYLNWQKKIENLNYRFKYKKALHYCNVALWNYLKIFHGVNNNVPSLVGNFKNSYEITSYSYFTLEEFKLFINHIDTPIYKTLFNFLFFTGCRLGETLALTFNDLKHNCIYINKTLTKESYNGSRILTLPKTKKSIRTLRIDNMLIEELAELQIYYIKKFGFFNNDFYIFGGLEPLSPSTIERKKNYYCDKAGLKRIRLHDFRHSHATLLFNNEVPINLITYRLGHSNINTTLTTYCHLIPENEKRTLEVLNSLR